jgi:hypothetical protein
MMTIDGQSATHNIDPALRDYRPAPSTTRSVIGDLLAQSKRATRAPLPAVLTGVTPEE